MQAVVSKSELNIAVPGEVSAPLRRLIRGLAEIAVELYLEEPEGNVESACEGESQFAAGGTG
jgi:hypothetical protein